MAIIRLQDKTPNVYTWESRDFQLISRLYDCVVNSVKYDIDSMLGVLDAAKCRSNILQLVQTKLGFFTHRDVEDDTLRCILQAFPLMVRAKGSLRAIQQAINTFLKAYGVTTEINVWYVNEAEVVYNTQVDDHTVIIGLNKALTNLYVLEEIFRYILPTGFGFYLYFYNTIDEIQEFAYKQHAKLIYASDNINSMIRGSSDVVSADDLSNRTLGGFDITEIASSDSLIPTVNGTYEPSDNSKFLGILTQEPATGSDNYTYIKLNNNSYELYYKYNSKWNKIDYKGAMSTKPSSMTNGLSWSIINDTISINGADGVSVELDSYVFEKSVGRKTKTYTYDGTSWIDSDTKKAVDLSSLGINVVGQSVKDAKIKVFENITSNSIINDKNICNHYIWFTGLTNPINTKCLYDLYNVVEGK